MKREAAERMAEDMTRATGVTYEAVQRQEHERAGVGKLEPDERWVARRTGARADAPAQGSLL